MAGERLMEIGSTLFDKHGALFVNNDDRVFARIRGGLRSSWIRAEAT
jgi:hypothetical protein